jgi:hypothetical protein
MTPRTPVQQQRRDRVETLIRIAEPGLNLLLAAGERLSRVVQRRDDDYYPPQRGTLPPSSPTKAERADPTGGGS